MGIQLFTYGIFVLSIIFRYAFFSRFCGNMCNMKTLSKMHIRLWYNNLARYQISTENVWYIKCVYKRYYSLIDPQIYFVGKYAEGVIINERIKNISVYNYSLINLALLRLLNCVSYLIWCPTSKCHSVFNVGSQTRIH